MAHQLTIPDDVYATIANMAQERGQSPDELAQTLLQRLVATEWEATCRQYDDLTASPVWQVMEAEAEAEIASGSGDVYTSDADFKQAFEQR